MDQAVYPSEPLKASLYSVFGSRHWIVKKAPARTGQAVNPSEPLEAGLWFGRESGCPPQLAGPGPDEPGGKLVRTLGPAC